MPIQYRLLTRDNRLLSEMNLLAPDQRICQDLDEDRGIENMNLSHVQAHVYTEPRADLPPRLGLRWFSELQRAAIEDAFPLGWQSFKEGIVLAGTTVLSQSGTLQFRRFKYSLADAKWVTDWVPAFADIRHEYRMFVFNPAKKVTS